MNFPLFASSFLTAVSARRQADTHAKSSPNIGPGIGGRFRHVRETLKMNGLLFAEIVIPFSRGALRVLYSKAMNGIARVNFAVVLLLLLAGAAAAAPPVVSKVEPPNWWPNHSVNPIRILITGSGFANA